MARLAPNKEAIVYEIIGLIESGKTYTEFMEVNGGKWMLPKTTALRYWNKAQEGFKFILEERKRVRESVILAEEKKAAKRQILSKERKLEVLEDIIQNKKALTTFIAGGKPAHVEAYPTPSDRMKALEIHNRITGDNAPSKHIVEVGKGAVNLDDLTEEERELFIKLGENL